jgi:phosphoribosyl-ATP pyrophosphohydrolase
MGYHTREIEKGKLGLASKIREELEELVDAEEQGNRILAMCELADIYGALEARAVNYGLEMDDLRIMAHATAAAFREGSR